MANDTDATQLGGHVTASYLSTYQAHVTRLYRAFMWRPPHWLDQVEAPATHNQAAELVREFLYASVPGIKTPYTLQVVYDMIRHYPLVLDLLRSTNDAQVRAWLTAWGADVPVVGVRWDQVPAVHWTRVVSDAMNALPGVAPNDRRWTSPASGATGGAPPAREMLRAAGAASWKSRVYLWSEAVEGGAVPRITGAQYVRNFVGTNRTGVPEASASLYTLDRQGDYQAYMTGLHHMRTANVRLGWGYRAVTTQDLCAHARASALRVATVAVAATPISEWASSRASASEYAVACDVYGDVYVFSTHADGYSMSYRAVGSRRRDHSSSVDVAVARGDAAGAGQAPSNARPVGTLIRNGTVHAGGIAYVAEARNSSVAHYLDRMGLIDARLFVPHRTAGHLRGGPVVPNSWCYMLQRLKRSDWLYHSRQAARPAAPEADYDENYAQ